MGDCRRFRLSRISASSAIPAGGTFAYLQRLERDRIRCGSEERAQCKRVSGEATPMRNALMMLQASDRDVIYTARITSTPLRLRESRIVADLLLQGLPEEAWTKTIVERNALQVASSVGVIRISNILRGRLEPLGESLWKMVRDGSKELATQAAMAGAIHHSRLLGDFMALVVREQRAMFRTQLEANLDFLGANLSPKKKESSRDTIRRYLCDSLFNKKRPIYWLFSSGEQKVFQCSVYLHRYQAGSLARMRSEYLIPLQANFAARIEKLQGDIESATSTTQWKSLEKELSRLQKQQVEVRAYDEQLRHYPDQRIALDLDDGVKQNYGKFGALLAEVAKVTGGKEDAE